MVASIGVVLAPGVELRCPHCGGWHEMVRSPIQSTRYANHMLYFQCAGVTHYAGQLGDQTQFATRGTAKITGLGCPRCRQPIAGVESELAHTVVLACACGHRWAATPPDVRALR